MTIYHLTSSADWKSAKTAGFYSADSLKSEGFIHCSTAEQLLRVANTFYLDVQEPVVLWIDPERLEAELRWEAPVHVDPLASEVFPHVHGVINLDAVIQVTALIMGDEGLFNRF